MPEETCALRAAKGEERVPHLWKLLTGREISWDRSGAHRLRGECSKSSLCRQADRLRPTQRVHVMPCVPHPEVCQGLGAGMQGLESKFRERVAVGYEETAREKKNEELCNGNDCGESSLVPLP